MHLSSSITHLFEKWWIYLFLYLHVVITCESYSVCSCDPSADAMKQSHCPTNSIIFPGGHLIHRPTDSRELSWWMNSLRGSDSARCEGRPPFPLQQKVYTPRGALLQWPAPVFKEGFTGAAPALWKEVPYPDTVIPAGGAPPPAYTPYRHKAARINLKLCSVLRFSSKKLSEKQKWNQQIPGVTDTLL